MKSVWPGILRTTALRVAAVYAVLFAVLTGAIVIVVFSLAERQIYIQIQEGLTDESRALSSLLTLQNPQVLKEMVRIHDEQEARAASRPGIHDFRYYLLADANGKVLVGDLDNWPKDAPASGWYRFRTSGNRDVLALVSVLPNGVHLLVGQSIATPESLGVAVRTWVVIGAGLALLAGLAGGTAVGAQVMRRIREAGAAAERIQSGYLSERLPTGGATESSLLAKSFNSMLDRIEAAILGLRDLAARTAHEMKNPLARTDRALARAQELGGGEQLCAELAAARGELADLARRIDALLRLSRIEAGDRPEFFSDVDVATLVTDVVDLYAPLAEESNRTLTLEAPPSLRLSGDRQLLAQALANLLDNAIRYAPAGCRIVVRLRDEPGHCILEVEDLATDTARSDSAAAGTTDRTPGGGFGLAIVRAIARLHGGELALERHPTSFTARLRLPKSAAGKTT